MGEFNVVFIHTSPKWLNPKEDHLLRVLLMEHVDRDKHDKADKELKKKLSKYK